MPEPGPSPESPSVEAWKAGDNPFVAAAEEAVQGTTEPVIGAETPVSVPEPQPTVGPDNVIRPGGSEEAAEEAPEGAPAAPAPTPEHHTEPPQA